MSHPSFDRSLRELSQDGHVQVAALARAIQVTGAPFRMSG